MDKQFIYKYQPLFLKDFEMDDDLYLLIRTLINMDSLNILFTGSVGSGKTSLIYSIIREYYEGKDYANNVLSINNLKEQGITYYRNEVKIFCQTPSNIRGKKKFIILDDIDLVNEQSQQVFRNCIDKYSHNVHFIASCSNTQRVIDSLQSRNSIIKLKIFTKENLLKILKKICSIENISITKEAEDFIITISNNSVRILINYLEKLKLLYCDITLDIVSKICTNITFVDFDNYTNFCKKNKTINAINIFYNLYDKGYSVMDILDNYFAFVKTADFLSEAQKYNIIQYISKYITIFHNIHENEIELAIFTNKIIQILNNSH